MKTQVLVVTAMLSFWLITSSVNAERGFARCVDENGDLTYTDFLCVTSEQGVNARLATEKAVGGPSEIINVGTLASTQLESVTNQVIGLCIQRFNNYFKRKHTASSTITSVEFNRIIDQYKKGDDVSVSVAGAVKYDEASETRIANIECTVQKFSEGGDWLIGFLEK